MKILVIDNDSERINTLKSLEFNGHLVQAVEALSTVREFLDGSVCQVLVLGPGQISGDPLKTFSEWRQSLGENISPWVVALGSRQDALPGIDHFFPIPFDEIDVVELPGLRGIPQEPEAIDHNTALGICDGDEDLLREIAEIFIKDSPGRIEKLTRGLEEKDWKAVREAAHLMKGSALNLAAESFRLANQGLERAGKAGSTPLVLFWSDQVVYEYNRLRNHLKGLADGSVNLS
jgi:HPt (histidine-containing phosphotransfer) domain-containing protein